MQPASIPATIEPCYDFLLRFGAGIGAVVRRVCGIVATAVINGEPWSPFAPSPLFTVRLHFLLEG